jgi:hypothetical protein
MMIASGMCTLAGCLGVLPSPDSEVFQGLRQFFESSGLVVVFIAGLSQAVGQGIILFVNRVKPLRFLLSLVLSALLFVAGYLFWSLSIWLVSSWLLDQPIGWLAVRDSLTLSYAPLTFSFLGAMPYLGMPLLRLLSLFSLVLVVLTLATLANLSAWQAAVHVGLGWLVLQILQQTAVGQPIVNLGRQLTDWTAGVKLVVDRGQLNTLVDANPLGADGAKERVAKPLLPKALENLRRPRSRRLTLLWVYASLGCIGSSGRSQPRTATRVHYRIG